MLRNIPPIRPEDETCIECAKPDPVWRDSRGRYYCGECIPASAPPFAVVPVERHGLEIVSYGATSRSGGWWGPERSSWEEAYVDALTRILASVEDLAEIAGTPRA